MAHNFLFIQAPSCFSSYKSPFTSKGSLTTQKFSNPTFAGSKPYLLPQTRTILKSMAKQDMTIITLGELDDGKTTLTSAITKVLSETGDATFTDVETLDSATSTFNGIKFNGSIVEYNSGDRHYKNIDCKGTDYQKVMVSENYGKIDGAIFVISSMSGIEPHTVEGMYLANLIDIPKVVVYISKTDFFDEVVEGVDDEINIKFGEYPFQQESVPIIRGSADLALENRDPTKGKDSIKLLVKTMDDFF